MNSLVLPRPDGGTVPNTSAPGMPGTNGQAAVSTALAAGYRSAHSSQWPSTRSRSHSRAPGLPAAGPSCSALAQTYASSQPGLRLEAHRRSPASPAPQQVIEVMQGARLGSDGPLQLDHRINWRKTSRRDWSAAARQGGLPSCSCTRIRGRPPAYPAFFTGVTARVCFSSALSLCVLERV